jgi:serine protease inhibitor
MYSKLEIPKDIIKSEHQRGIYFSTFYDNSREYLRGEIEEDKLVKSFDTSVEGLTNLWKERYARKRITNLVNNQRTSLDTTLFYDDVISMSWEETKQKYLGEVGR